MNTTEAAAPAPPTQFPARVIAVRPICARHVAVELACPDASGFAPGRFLQITSTADQLAPPSLATHAWGGGQRPKLTAAELAGHRPLLRRPYSPADVWRAGEGDWRIRLIVRILGPGTRCLSQRRAGEVLDVIGPIGNTFTVPPRCRTLLLIAGGTGFAPLAYLARHLHRRRGEAAPRMVALVGAARREWLCCDVDASAPPAEIDSPAFCVRQFAEAGAAALISTDDGSLGFAGVVTDLAAAWLKRHRPPPAQTQMIAVGPEPMMAAAACLADGAGVPVQVSLERKMGCGLGTCQSCVVPILTGEGGWRYRLTCRDGPVFDGRRVLWARQQAERPD